MGPANNVQGAAWVGRGKVLATLGQQGDALDSFNRAIALDPNLAEAYFDRGATLMALGKRDTATISYQQAADLFDAQNNIPQRDQALAAIAALQTTPVN